MSRTKRIKSHNISEIKNNNIDNKKKWLFIKITPKWLLIVFTISIAIFVTTTILLIHFYL